MIESLKPPMKREIIFNKQFDQESIGELTSKIIDIENDDEYLKSLYSIHQLIYTPNPIKIYIDSYGGYVYQCLGLLSIMESCKTPIHTIVTGCAMSCGFMVLISGHKRFGYQLSTPLYHQVSTGFRGTIKELEEELIETRRLQKIIENITLKKTKITKRKLKEIYNTKTDWYMTPDEALKLGVIDEIIK